MGKCVVIPTEDAAHLPLFHYVVGLIEVAGHEPVVAGVDAAVDGSALVVAFGRGCRRAADAPLGAWLSPDFGDEDTAAALVGASGPGLIVGSLDDAGWDRAAAARLRQYEVLHLPRVNRFFEIPGDPIGSIDVMRQILDRLSAMIRRVE